MLLYARCGCVYFMLSAALARLPALPVAETEWRPLLNSVGLMDTLAMPLAAVAVWSLVEPSGAVRVTVIDSVAPNPVSQTETSAALPAAIELGETVTPAVVDSPSAPG